MDDFFLLTWIEEINKMISSIQVPGVVRDILTSGN
jgi:hypothetical protein